MFHKALYPSRGFRLISAAALGVALAVLGARAFSAQDKYTLRVPDGLAFSDFRGYENWQVVAVSQTDDLLKVMVANPIMMSAYRVRRSRQRQAFSRRLQDCKNRVEAEKEYGSPFFCEGTGHFTRRLPHREEQEEIPGHEGMGVRRI